FLLEGTWIGILNQFLQMADYDPFISNNAHNLWWLVGWGYGLQIRDMEPFIGPLSYRVTAALTLLTVFLFALWRLWRQRGDEPASLEIAAYIGLALFMLMTVVHENHVFAVLPLLSLILWRDRRVVALYVAITTVNLINLALADTGVFVVLQRHGLHYWLTALTLANAVGYLAIFLWWTASVAGLTARDPRWRVAGVGATAAAAAAVFLASPQLVSPSYRPSPGVTASDAVWNNQIRLLDYRIVEQRVNAGEVAHVTFTWQAMTDIDAHYMLFVHALDQQNRLAGQMDGPPTRNAYPTRVWRAGDVIHDQRAIPIARDAFGVYRLEIGFYPLTDYQRLRVVTEGRTDDRLVLGAIVAPPRGHAPPSTTPILFGETIRLFPPPALAPARAGQIVEVPLTFTTARPVSADYTVFVQVLDDAGRVLAQHDSQPADARFPTSVWSPSDVVPHTARIALPAAVPAGAYRVIAGLYYLPTGERLRAERSDYAEIGRLPVVP
ncbi:MAG: hypothetical protein NZ518_03555, partial [Dehalococcoidia bacterium]|nr:hypothetical protein [Dehalococcoidia bacterium]